jgi:hypothetical protein
MEHCNLSLRGSRRQALMINLTGNRSTFSSAAPCGFSASFKRTLIVLALTPQRATYADHGRGGYRLRS